MGKGNLVSLPASPTQTLSEPEQLNQVIDALTGTQVMRDPTTGIEIDGGFDIGEIADGRPDYINVKSGIRVGGITINASSHSLSKTGIQSGTSNDSGYPTFMSPGSGGRFAVLGSSTPLQMTIDGVAYTLAADLVSDALTLAPSSNNTVLINDYHLTGEEWTTVFGEYSGNIMGTGYSQNNLAVDTMGSEITALIGTIQIFKKGGEYLLAYIESATVLNVYKRGIAGSERETLSNNDTLTLMFGYWNFLKNDLITIYSTRNSPLYGDALPSGGGTTNDFFFLVGSGNWYRYSGTSWEMLGLIPLGLAICNSGGCQATECVDFDLGWEENIAGGDIQIYNATQLIVKSPLFCNVAGKDIKVDGFKIIDITTDLEVGLIEAASTYYFVYVDINGKFYLSDKKPRKPGQRKAWYHPQQYWRCIGICYNMANSNLQTWNAEVAYITLDIKLTPETFVNKPQSVINVPIGAIIPWHKTFANSLSTIVLPIGWQECDGSLISDTRSPMHGSTMPNINGLGQFIRGSATSGTVQYSQNKSHSHTASTTAAFNNTPTVSVSTNPNSLATLGNSGSGTSIRMDADYNGALGDLMLISASSTIGASTIVNASTAGTPDESRPDNISMVYIMRIF
jgi:hypothetical protein